MRQANFPEVTVVWREPDRLPAAYIRVLLVVGSPPYCSFGFIAFETSLSALFAFAFCCPRAFRLSACVSRLGCCRGGFPFRLRPNSPVRLLQTLPPPSRR